MYKEPSLTSPALLLTHPPSTRKSSRVDLPLLHLCIILVQNSLYVCFFHLSLLSRHFLVSRRGALLPARGFPDLQMALSSSQTFGFKGWRLEAGTHPFAFTWVSMRCPDIARKVHWASDTWEMCDIWSNSFTGIVSNWPNPLRNLIFT